MRLRLPRQLLLALVLPLAGCITSGQTGLGPTAVPASAGAAALGEGLIGQSRALKLPADARGMALDAEFQALQFAPAGQAVAWKARAVEGSVVPTQLYRVGSQDCRGYSHTVRQAGRETKVVGAACRVEQGFWKPVV